MDQAFLGMWNNFVRFVIWYLEYGSLYNRYMDTHGLKLIIGHALYFHGQIQNFSKGTTFVKGGGSDYSLSG